MARDSFGAWIDCFRWMAAASVLITHVGIRMLVPIADLPAVSLIDVAYAFLAGFDHQAVMVFFVLSGLLVGGSAVREIQASGRFALGAYLGRRLIRLWLVLLPALAVTAVCTGLALVCGGAELGTVPDSAADALGVAVLVCNAAFLQTAACPQYGGNGALWSLFNEFWYYLIFPAVALAVLTPGRPWWRVALAGGAALVLAGLTAGQTTGSPIGPYMLVWCSGVAASALPRPVVARAWLAAVLFVAASLAVRITIRRAFATDHPLLSAELDLLLALLFGNLLLTLRWCPALPPPPWPRLHAALAGFSFSLYCTHIPVLVLFITVLQTLTGTGWHMRGAGLAQWGTVGGGLTLCVGFAWLFAQATEAQTGRIRRWAKRAWTVQRAAARPAVR